MKTWTHRDFLRDAANQRTEHNDATNAERWDRDQWADDDTPSPSELAADAWADRMEER